MPRVTKEVKKEIDKEIKEKLKYIGLDFENVPEELLEHENISYRATRMLEESSYKMYRYIDPTKIEILITPQDRLEDLAVRYKKSDFLAEYIDIGERILNKQIELAEKLEKNATFLGLLKKLDIGRLKELEEYQKQLNEQVPYEIKYKENYIWQIFYAEAQDKYFMLFPSNETRVESLFYLIKKKIEATNKRKTKKVQQTELIYVPICDTNYSHAFLKKSEMQDLENYLWLFTKDWPNIYELYNKEGKQSIEIVGQTKVYEQIKSIYKISINTKEEASKIFKLIKALFILQTEKAREYDFRSAINEKGSLEFYYHSKKIVYENLPEFIKQEVEIRKTEWEKITSELIFKLESLELLQETIKAQNEEYIAKERQIVTFLECKKSFFGRMKYFFKTKKQDKKEVNIKQLIKEKKLTKEEKQEEVIMTSFEFEEKEQYTIEDLLNLCNLLEEKEKSLKNKQMDIKALQNKKQNLENRIRNATLYINEIESHKKSIFDFWKYTNKDSVNLLNESEIKEKEENTEKLKRAFNYEEDMEEVAKKIDEMQKNIFSKNEVDSIFAIREDLSTFNLLLKTKLLKREEKEIEKSLEILKEKYKKNIEEIAKKDFDLFGNTIEDKTKIKILKNNKHRENSKDKFNVLGINLDTTAQQYKENMNHYRILLKEIQEKMYAPYDMQLYLAKTEEWLPKDEYAILQMNATQSLQQIDKKKDTIYLYQFNIKEKMPIAYYSNIMFFDNYNKTLPVGMDITEEALLYLPLFDIKLISRKNFYSNIVKNEFESQIKFIQLYEYEMERKQNGK